MDWKELFGSDDEEEEEQVIPGLKLMREALDHKEQMAMTHGIIQDEYFSNNVNQGMCFGKLPSYISPLSNWAVENQMFENDILRREPLFDQAILNLYKKGLLF